MSPFLLTPQDADACRKPGTCVPAATCNRPRRASTRLTAEPRTRLERIFPTRVPASHVPLRRPTTRDPAMRADRAGVRSVATTGSARHACGRRSGTGRPGRGADGGRARPTGVSRPRSVTHCDVTLCSPMHTTRRAGCTCRSWRRPNRVRADMAPGRTVPPPARAGLGAVGMDRDSTHRRRSSGHDSTGGMRRS